MPVISQVAPTNSLDQWRSLTNQVITAINNQSINEIVEIVTPLNDQDILVYNATGAHAGFFVNTGIDALVSAIIANLASIPSNTIYPYFLSQTIRQVF